MKFATRQIFLISFLIMSTSVLAYNPATHENFSEAAVDQSVLSTDATLLPGLGLKAFTTKQNFFISSLTGSRSIVDHVRNGARIEDSFARSLNHFYNPLTQKSLLGIPSPDWALEDIEDISDQFSSFKNARENFYRALTSSDADEKEKYFGLTFETLGNVIHHTQDMAQPQHVRDDEHCDILPCKIVGRHNPSAYELYALNLRRALVVSGYPSIYSLASPTPFTSARYLWTTPDAKGIADYTNRGFVSSGTNFRGMETNIQPASGFPHPNGAGATIEKRRITDPDLRGPKGPNQPLEGTIYFIQTPVTDNLTGESVLSRTSTFSIFDADLTEAGQEAVFSMNEYNYKAASDLLTKRAVAYSAGLIDYFFRGKLSAEDVAFTDAGVSLRVKNAIEPAKIPAWQNEVLYAKNSNGSAGSFTVVFDYQDNTGKTQYGVSNTVPVRAADTLAPGQVSADVYDFTLSVSPDAKDVNYRLIFRGKLGQEDDAMAVGKVEPVSGFLVGPSYKPADGITGSRTIYRTGGDWKLSQETDGQAGSVDWKGWYVNGRPTKVLTWAGPTTRYFPQTYDPNSYSHLGPNGYLGLYGNRVYQNGELFAIAPRVVLGAALMRDSARNEWLVVICRDGMADVVYRRPNAKSNSTSGWQQIGRFTHDPNMLNTANLPWFFNGSGTEAQTMRSGWLPPSKPWLFRLKINIQDLNVAISNEGNLDGHTIESIKTATCREDFSSGSLSESHKVLEIMPKGRFVIAVDYVDNQPVYATYFSEGVTRYTIYSFFQMLGESQRNVHYEVFQNRAEKINMTDYGDIILYSAKGTHWANYSIVGSTGSGAGKSDMVITIGHLRYLDLRYGLYSIRSQVTHINGPAPENDVIGSEGKSYVMPYIRQKEQTMSFLSQEFPFHVAPEPSQSYAVRPYDIVTAVIPCNSNVTTLGTVSPYFLDLGPSYLYDPLYIDFTLRGNRQPISVAVDSSKNLFLSESRMDASPSLPPNNVGYFNYLTGGNPGIVIPYAPDGAHYDPIRVIR